jgi:sulfite exporter TauE/SafE
MTLEKCRLRSCHHTNSRSIVTSLLFAISTFMCLLVMRQGGSSISTTKKSQYSECQQFSTYGDYTIYAFASYASLS